jgi:hypothetical protein
MIAPFFPPIKPPITAPAAAPPPMIPIFAPVDKPRSLSRYLYCALAVVAAADIKINPKNIALSFLVNIVFHASVFRRLQRRTMVGTAMTVPYPVPAEAAAQLLRVVYLGYAD